MRVHSGDLATPDESRGASCQLWKTRSCPCCTFIWAGADQSGGPAFVSKYIRILIKGLYQEPLSRRPGRDLRARCATQGLLVPARELATRLWASWASWASWAGWAGWAGCLVAPHKDELGTQLQLQTFTLFLLNHNALFTSLK